MLSASGPAVAFWPASLLVAFFSFLGLGFANLALFRRYCTSLSRAATLSSMSLDSSRGFSAGESLFCSASVSFFQFWGTGGKRRLSDAFRLQELLCASVLLPLGFPTHCR